jgi:integrase
MGASFHSRPSSKPAKPYPDFPLFPHATKRWAKKIRGKLHYFGSWANGWQASLQKYQDQRDDLHAGRTPRVRGEGLTINELVDRFLAWKKQLVDGGELQAETWQDYSRACIQVADAFSSRRLVSDLASDDFEKLRALLAKTRGPRALGCRIVSIRSLFKYAYDAGLIPTPIRYGHAFAKPGRALVRKERAKNGPRMFTAEEIRRMTNGAGPELRAMILLGINAGFGNTDCSRLELKHLNLQTAWIDFPRPKTGIHRRAKLWPESVQAIVAWQSGSSNNDAERVFARSNEGIGRDVAKLLHELELNGRNRLGFYSLRHTFLTIAEETRDFPVVQLVMGHSDNTMASHYRERISDSRLEAVTDHVRKWLFGADESRSK